MLLDEDMIDRIATAIESAQVGYSLTLTRLVDEERTYTLTYSDGTPPLTFDDIDDGYLHIRERKRRAQAAAVIAALEAPEIDGGRFAEWSLSTIARQCRAQSREQLDPEFSQFMAEVSNRLFGVMAERATANAAKKSPAMGGAEESGSTEMRNDVECSGLNVHPSHQAQQSAAEKNGQSVSGDPHGHPPLSKSEQIFCPIAAEESSIPQAAKGCEQ